MDEFTEIRFIVLFPEAGDYREVKGYLILSSAPDPREMARVMTESGLSCFDIEDAEIYIVDEKFELPKEVMDELLEEQRKIEEKEYEVLPEGEGNDL